MFQVYLIKNSKDPVHLYVGVSVNAYQRFIKHCSRSSKCRKLRRAIRRDGRDSFSYDVVLETPDEAAAYAHEQELIKKLRAAGHKLYNLTAGGKGAAKRRVGPKTRRKISEAMKARKIELPAAAAVTSTPQS